VCFRLSEKKISNCTPMISRNKVKFLISLQKKQIRDKERVYVIEGDKLVKEFLLSDKRFITLVAKPEFIGALPEDLLKNAGEIITAGYHELKRVSTLKTPHNAMAVVPMPELKFDTGIITDGLCVALDFIQDPGNLGTIIRAAAWFGIKNIICSEYCVDKYNPKVIQASMGSIMHVNIFNYDLRSLLTLAGELKVSVYGAVLEGKSVYNQKGVKTGIILLGNESKGISEELMSLITKKIMIPRFNSARYGIDSLNVGMAASIVFSEFAKKRIRITSENN